MPSILDKIINYARFPGLSSFPVISELLKKFPKAEAFLVGGAVRDILLRKKVTDFDILVRGVPSNDLGDFLASRGRVIFAGQRFGVWKFQEIGKKNKHYDISLPRTEFSLHNLGIYKDFDIQTDHNLPIEEDLKRRDFTINAMAYNLANNELIDPHNGRKDLEGKIIRCVGNPKERFSEDYSRLLRALRFSLQLDFEIESETKKNIVSLMPNVNNEVKGKRVLPYEVIAEEFLKSTSYSPKNTLELWDENKALQEIMPEILKMKNCPQPVEWHTEGDVWTHTKLALENLESPAFKKEFKNDLTDIELVLGVMFHDIGKPYTLKTPEKDGVDRVRFDNHDQVGAEITKQVLNRLKVSAPPQFNAKPERVAWMVRYHMLTTNGNPIKMKPTTIEKYFFNRENPSRNLLKLMFVDGLATIGKDGKGVTDHYQSLKKRIEEIKKISGSRGPMLSNPLINGQDVISVLNVKQGPKIGEILEKTRQAQLDGKIKNKKEAVEFLKTLS